MGACDSLAIDPIPNLVKHYTLFILTSRQPQKAGFTKAQPLIPLNFLNLYTFMKQAFVSFIQLFSEISRSTNSPFSYFEKEPESNDILVHFVEFLNVHNNDRISNITRSNLSYIQMYKGFTPSRLCSRIAKR